MSIFHRFGFTGRAIRVKRRGFEIVFGNGLGKEVIEYIINETPVFTMIHGNFDEILMNENSKWFESLSRNNCLKKACERGLKDRVIPYGQYHGIYLTNMFFGGSLPKFLGFDYGPIPLVGSRATISQGQKYKSAGRESNFGPSFRMIVDFKNDILHTNIAGGPSDRRFSKHYKSQIKEWFEGKYWELSP